jgi:hypothetical protein
VTFPDFMPTFLELGGIAIPDYVDGTSLVPLLNGTVSDNDTVTDDWRSALLLEGHEPSFPERDYFAIRTADGLKYIEYRSGFKEFYDLASDPYEMDSNPSSAPAALVDRLRRLKTCAGDTCRSIEREGSGSTPSPETSITSGPAEGSSTTSNSATFGFSSDEQGSTFRCQLSKEGTVTQAWAACTSPKAYSNLTPGNYKFEVQATDSAGNADPTPASRSWTIMTSSTDTTPPRVTSTVPAANATGVASTANVTATFSEAMDTITTDGDPSTITSTTFKLFKVNADGSTTRVTNVSVSPSSDALKATLDPYGTSTTTHLAKGTKYKAVVTTEAMDVAGNPLDQNTTTTGLQQKAWFFTVS